MIMLRKQHSCARAPKIKGAVDALFLSPFVLKAEKKQGISMRNLHQVGEGGGGITTMMQKRKKAPQG